MGNLFLLKAWAGQTVGEASGDRALARPDIYVDLHLVLLKDRSVLLGRRLGLKFGAGLYHVPAGHLEPDETVIDGIIREAREEIGIELHPNDLDLAYMMHYRSDSDRLSLFFRANQWRGSIENLEPDKCAGWEWHATDALPENMVQYARQAITELLTGKRLGLLGWRGS